MAFGASLYFCVIFGQRMFLRWSENPLKMKSFQTKTPISDIPFPTVTVCIDAKVNANIMNVTHMKEMLTESPQTLSDSEYVGLISRDQYRIHDVNYNLLISIRLSKVHALAHVCPHLLPANYESNQMFSDDSIYSVLQEISLRIDTSMMACEWRQKPVDCNKIFTKIITEKGLCFIFNELNSRDMYTDE